MAVPDAASGAACRSANRRLPATAGGENLTAFRRAPPAAGPAGRAESRGEAAMVLLQRRSWR
jgi:hypothetical protein